MKNKIRFIARVILWRDDLNGNTYHSVHVVRSADGAGITSGLVYGYGSAYKQTTYALMQKKRWIRTKNEYRYECQADYPIYWIISTGTKTECKENGKGC